VVIEIKKPDCLLPRQPGYLYKTRGFPSPDYSEFGFFIGRPILNIIKDLYANTMHRKRIYKYRLNIQVVEENNL